MLDIQKRMDEDYFELIDSIRESREALKKWLKVSSLEAIDREEFITDIQRELLKLSSHLLRFKHARVLVAEHKQKNYYDELTEAIRICSELNEYLGDHYNPIFKNRDEQYIEASQKMRDVDLYLRRKQIDIIAEEKAIVEKKLKEHEKKLNELIKINGAEKTIRKMVASGKINDKKISNEDEIKLFIAHKFCLEEGKKIIKGMNKFKREEDKYDFTKTKNMKEIRVEFLKSLAHVFKFHTGRTTVKRSKEEIGKRKKSPFKELAKVCFKEIGEEVKPETLKKLIAEVNK